MNKQAKKLSIMMVVLLVLIAVFFFLKNRNETEDDTREEGIVVVDINEEDVVEISVNYGENNYTLEKDDGVWYVKGDHSTGISEGYVDNMVRRIAPLTATMIISDVEDYKQYGLDNPEGTVTFSTADETYAYMMGDYNSTSSVSYIKLDGDENVYAVQQGVVTAFQKSLEDISESAEQ